MIKKSGSETQLLPESPGEGTVHCSLRGRLSLRFRMKISYFAETSGHQDLLISLRGVESAYFPRVLETKRYSPNRRHRVNSFPDWTLKNPVIRCLLETHINKRYRNYEYSINNGKNIPGKYKPKTKL